MVIDSIVVFLMKKSAKTIKIYCFNDKLAYYQVIFGRSRQMTFDFYDLTWAYQEFMVLRFTTMPLSIQQNDYAESNYMRTNEIRCGHFVCRDDVSTC